MHLYEDIKAEIIGNMKEKRNNPEKAEYYNVIIAAFKSIKAKGEAIAKERKVEVNTDIMFEALLKEQKELKQTLDTTPDSSPLHATAAIQLEAINRYAPRKLSYEKLYTEIEDIVKTQHFKNFGEAMKYCREYFKFTADGKDISTILKDLDIDFYR